MHLGKTIEELEEISYLEFLEWQAFFAYEPFGYVRSDVNAAIIAHTTAQMWCRKRLKVADFIPKWKNRVKTQEEISNQVLAFFLSVLPPKD